MSDTAGTPRPDFHDMRLLDGVWPEDIRGFVWINGAGRALPWQRHSVFAPGVLQRLDLEPKDGRLRWARQDLRTFDVQAALAHAELFADPRTRQYFGGPLTAINNALFDIGDRLFVTADINRPWELDPASMSLRTVVGTAREYGGGGTQLSLLSPFVPTAAHPFYDRRDGLLYTYSSRPSPRSGASLSQLQHELFVITWDGVGEVKRWRVPGAGLTQYVHDVRCTRNFVILLESCSFRLEPGLLNLGLDKLRPDLPVTNLLVIRKSDLTEENRGRGVPFRKITIPVESFHLSVDYADDGVELELWVTHGNGLDFLMMNDSRDVHWRTGRPFERAQLGQYAYADYAPAGHYRVHVERQALIQSQQIIHPERYWGPSVWSWDTRLENVADSTLYLSWVGYDEALVSKRLMAMYGDRPHRILPTGTLPRGSHAPALTAIHWRTGAVEQSYLYPAGTATISNQFIPRPGSGNGGWVGVYLVRPGRVVEYWLFDAERLASGPVARLGCEGLRPVAVIHHHWTPEAPSRTATYHVAPSEDIDPDWRQLPAPYRRVIEDGLRFAEHSR